MKKILSVVLALTLMMALCACGGNTPDTGDDNRNTTTTTTTAAATTTTEAVVEDTTTAPIDTTTEAQTTTVATETAAPTTSATKGVTATKAPTTTKKVTTTTMTYAPVPESISILAVGNSFSVDAMRHHLYPMLQSAGYKNIRLGILYIGGASIDTHYDNLRLDRGKYQYQEDANGT